MTSKDSNVLEGSAVPISIEVCVVVYAYPTWRVVVESKRCHKNKIGRGDVEEGAPKRSVSRLAAFGRFYLMPRLCGGSLCVFSISKSARSLVGCSCRPNCRERSPVLSSDFCVDTG